MRSSWAETLVSSETREAMDAILDAGFRVHRSLGPGFLESVYRRCLVHALRKDGRQVEEEVYLPIQFDDLRIERAHRADLVVDSTIIVETKAVDPLHPLHSAQLIAYLKASGLPAGVILNFNVPYFRAGYERRVHPDLLRDASSRVRVVSERDPPT